MHDTPEPHRHPHMDRLTLIKACDYRGEEPVGCGCNELRRCRRDSRDVSLSDCLRCVAGP